MGSNTVVTSGNPVLCVECKGTGRIKGKGLCRRCYNRAYSAGRLPGTKTAARAAAPVLPVLVEAPRDAEAAPESEVKVNDGARLLIDFAQFPEIYEALLVRSRDELRPIEYQALFSLRAALAVAG